METTSQPQKRKGRVARILGYCLLGLIILAFLPAIYFDTIGRNSHKGKCIHWRQAYFDANREYDDGQYGQAADDFNNALKLARKLGPYNWRVGLSEASVAETYAQLGRFSEAEPLLKDALTIYERKYGKNSYEAAFVINSLGNNYRLLGNYHKAEQTLLQSMVMAEAAKGPNYKLASKYDNDLGLL